MKKFYYLFFSLQLITFLLKAQEKVNIDYQYTRNNNEYHAYAVYLKSDDQNKTLEFEVTSTYLMDKLTGVSIKKGKMDIKIPFTKLDTVIKTDEKTINNLVIVASIKNLLKMKIECGTVIIFTLSDETKIELPFNFCLVKNKIENN
ncbi:MAG: hypothetical protein V4546_14620 [Bacteroidota bacterium]